MSTYTEKKADVRYTGAAPRIVGLAQEIDPKYAEHLELMSSQIEKELGEEKYQEIWRTGDQYKVGKMLFNYVNEKPENWLLSMEFMYFKNIFGREAVYA